TAPSLQYAASDAQRLHDLMCDPARGGLLPDHAFVLHDLREADAEKPTRANIEARVREIAARAQPTDTILFFFSGHGAVDKQGNTYLLTRDAESGSDRLKGTALDRTALDDLLRILSPRPVILFTDACHAAGVMGDSAA